MNPPPRARRLMGVLVVNLGTPASPRTSDVRRYLRQFLSDPKVVEISPWLWRPLLEGVILPLRARKSAELYGHIWSEDGSPLLRHGRRQCELLAERLGDRFLVRLGMRYGSPSIAEGVEQLCASGCDRILLFPLFPQYSSSTTGTTYAEFHRCIGQHRVQPASHTVPPYPDDPDYIEALAARVLESPGRIDHYVVSFHGLPQAYVERGDPYLEHCRATAGALQARLRIEDRCWSIVFQSRFGRQPWLQPYADEFVPSLARKHPRVLVVMPGFTSDCLETLEEVGLRLRSAFHAAGGEELVVVPSLNDHPAWIHAMEALVRRWSALGPE